jgi:hypothetical protein
MWRRVVIASTALVVVCLLGFVGSLVWHAFGSDYDKYGRIDIPGSGTVALPAGEVDVDYAVRLATNGGGGALTVPDLHFTMSAPDGVRDPVVTNAVGGTVTVNSASHVRVWKVRVVDAGDYAITTDGDVGGFIEPQLTFGEPSSVPLWPTFVFGALFFVFLGLLLVASHAQGRPGRQDAPTTLTASGAPASGGPPYGPAASALPTTSTPEQELARLARLQQLSDLHASGTLTDAEYDAAGAAWAGPDLAGPHSHDRAVTNADAAPPTRAGPSRPPGVRGHPTSGPGRALPTTARTHLWATAQKGGASLRRRNNPRTLCHKC